MKPAVFDPDICNGLAPFEEDSFIVTRLTRFF